MLKVDHFVLGCADLQAALPDLTALLGPPVGFGRHDFMGTHNALWRVGEAYLEVIAIDPDGVTPSHPRWFGLDGADLAHPRLIAWMAATDDLEGAIARSPLPFEPPLACARDALTWRVALPQGRVPLAGGTYPHLIQWDAGVTPPGQSLTDSGLRVARVALAAPDETHRALDTLGALPLFDELAKAESPAMTVTLIRADGRRITLGGSGVVSAGGQ